jgi:hypothetical protein
MKTISEFMMTLHKELKEKRDVADATASQYIRTLYTLNSDRPFNNLAWLKNTDSVELRISEYAESTQKAMLSTIVSALSTISEKSSYKKIFAYWYNRMMDKSNEFRNKDTTIKSPTQEKNWLSWDVVLAHEKRLGEEAEKVVKLKVLSNNDWSNLLGYMILSLYTKFSPRRNQDYQFMKVVKSEKQASNLDFNYYVTDKQEFIFNKYKTAKVHGAQKFAVPEELVSVINLYLKKHPGVSKSPYFFLVQHDDTPLPSVNSITRILNRIFGKNVGTTMLRHIYLSAKYDVSEMNEDAERMGHTSGMQREYMKVDSVEIPEY